jgi:hypothetical protein
MQSAHLALKASAYATDTLGSPSSARVATCLASECLSEPSAGMQVLFTMQFLWLNGAADLGAVLHQETPSSRRASCPLDIVTYAVGELRRTPNCRALHRPAGL